MGGRVVNLLGRTHALSGVVTGAAVGSVILHEQPAPLGLFVALTAAYSLASDLDACHATEARSLGFVTEALAWIVEKISGGHRHGTHSLAGVAAFTGAAALACLFRHDWPGRIALFLILAAGFAAALDALRIGGHPGNIAALAGAAAMAWTGYGLALVPLAAALGCSTHLAGDGLTKCGVPLLWPATMHEFHLTPRLLWFTTGHWPERFIVTPVLLLALGLLCWHDAGTLTLAPHVRTAIGAP
jgi:membrane-bound metal-dependent hydrolase YbcI (DUF457 family)